MHRRPVILAALALLFIGPAPLPAQMVGPDSGLVPGQRARLTYQRLRRPLIGEFVSADSGEIIMREPQAGVYYIKWDNVARLEASVAQRPRRETVMRGVLIGYATGIALGGSALMLADMFGFDESCCVMADTRTLATRGTVLMTVGGGLIGLSWPNDTWQRVPLRERPPGLTMIPLRLGQVGVGLTLGAFGAGGINPDRASAPSRTRPTDRRCPGCDSPR